MAKRVKHILLGFFAAVSLLILSVLFIPAVSRFALEKASLHFLGHRLEIRAYHFSPMRCYLDGVFDDNSTIQIEGSRLLNATRHATVQMHSRTAFFDTVAGTKLPNADFNATVNLSQSHIRADLRVLGGTVRADFEPRTSRYAYTLEAIALDEVFNALALPAYASGTVSGSGRGVSVAPYSLESVLTSYNIRPGEPLIALTGLASLRTVSEIKATNRLSFEDGRLLHDGLHVASRQFRFDLNDTSYDLTDGAFSYKAAFFNEGLKAFPVHQAVSDGTGHYKDNRLSGDFTVRTDQYRLKLEQVHYNAKVPTLSAGFFVTTVAKEPYNLTGQNALQGSLAYADSRFDANLTTHGMTEPLQIRYKSGKASVISNNIPLGTVADILNRPGILHGLLDIDGTVDTHAPYPAVSLTTAAKKVMPPADIAAALNLTSPVNVTMRLKGDAGHYRAELLTDSRIMETGMILVDYDARRRRAIVDGTINKLLLPWYKSADIKLHTEADLPKHTLLDTRIVSPFETFSIPAFDFSKELNLSMRYRIGALDRFVPDANRTADVTGSASVERRGAATDIHVTADNMATMTVVLNGTAKSLFAKEVNIGRVFTLLGRPAPVSGTAELAARFGPADGAVMVHSERLTPLHGWQTTLRSFPLDASITFTRRGPQDFSGQARVNTAHDTLFLSPVDLNLSDRRLDAVYRLDSNDTLRSALIVPKGYIGNKLALKGRMRIDAQRQLLSVRTVRMALAPKLHHYFDKNATGEMPVSIDLNASRQGESADVNAAVVSDYFTLSPVHASYRQKTSAFSLEALLNTGLKIGRTFARFKGTVEGGSVSQGTLSVTAGAQKLEVTGLQINPEKKDFDADIKLALAPLDAPKTPKRAMLYGSIHTRPQMHASLYSESFEGNISAVMNDTLLIVHAVRLSIPQLLHFVSEAPRLTEGTLSADIILNSPPILEGNLSRLSGGIDLRAQNLRIEGIDIDSYLETLRNTQDLSLFQGSLFELPIVRSVKSLPQGLLSKDAIRTVITQARFAASVSDGILVCEDCAAATPTHRVAFAGDIDLTTRRFKHFYAALLNPKGCPYFMQRINGTLDNPRVDLAESGVKVIGGAVVSLASNVTDAADWLTGIIYRVTSATGEVLRYVPIAGKAADSALNTVSGTLHGVTGSVTGCTPFYIGVIPPPSAKKR